MRTVADRNLLSQVSFSGETMGTTYQVQIAGAELSPAAVKALESLVVLELLEVNKAMSTYMPESEISRFNRLEVGKVFPLGPRFREVLVRSIEIYEQTNRIFDPTLGPLINLWGFGEAGAQGAAPTQEQIENVLKRVGLNLLQLSVEGLSKSKPDIEINLSAIAKGYGVDRVAELLSEQGFENIYVEIGGELMCRGLNKQGTPWRIGIQLPAMGASEKSVQVVSLADRGLATSGDYRNYVADENGLRHHLLDPRTGRPAKHTLASVSVMADDCMTADAIATALFVMGTEEGMKWIGEQQGLDALFIDREEEEYRITSTPGFEKALIAIP